MPQASKSQCIFNVHEAKMQLSKLLEAALAGEDVIIARAGEPVARLVPLQGEVESLGKRVFGAHKGKLKIPADFDDPLPELEEYT